MIRRTCPARSHIPSGIITECAANSSSAPCTSHPKAFKGDPVKSINIFKAGTHTSAGGTTLDFSDDVLQASASAYDPAIHAAPMVIGHPADNGPALGWISALSYAEGELHADPDQVNADFEGMVQAGSFKKVSASFYGPDSPANPVPGTYYLRHVGFLARSHLPSRDLKPSPLPKARRA